MGKKRKPRSGFRVIDSRRKRRIMIGVPTMNNYMNGCLSEFMTECVRAGSRSDTPYRFSTEVVNGAWPVNYARNRLVGKFLQSKDDELWFLDSDMVPQPSALRILEIDADIRCGKMWRFDHKNPATGSKWPGIALCAFHASPTNPGKYRPLTPSAGESCVQQVDALGTASMLIKRKVLEDRRLWADGKYKSRAGVVEDCWEPDDLWAPPVFQLLRKPNGQPLVGEDIEFCERAGALGYTMKVDLEAVVGHYKSVDLEQVADFAHMVSVTQKSLDPGSRFIAREIRRCESS